MKITVVHRRHPRAGLRRALRDRVLSAGVDVPEGPGLGVELIEENVRASAAAAAVVSG